MAICAALEKTIDGLFHHGAQLTVAGFIEVGVDTVVSIDEPATTKDALTEVLREGAQTA